MAAVRFNLLLVKSSTKLVKYKRNRQRFDSKILIKQIKRRPFQMIVCF